MKVLVRYAETIACSVQVETDLTPEQLQEVTAYGVPQWRVMVNDALTAKLETLNCELVDFELEGIDRL